MEPNRGRATSQRVGWGPYASHGGGVHLHVLAALPNALFLESGLRQDGAPTRLVDGCHPLPEAPGLGAPA